MALIPQQNQEMPFLEHLRELRQRLIVSAYAMALGFLVGYALYHHYIGFLIRPFGEQLYIHQIEQGFTLRIRSGIMAGLILSFPVHIYNVLAFIMPALEARERRAIKWLLGGSFCLIMMGGYIGYFQILPLSIKFLKGPDFVPAEVVTQLHFQESLGFVFQIMLAFIALFQLPLVLLILMALGLVKRRWLLRASRYVLVVIFILSAVLTPPDVASQIGLAVPLIILYFLTMLVAKLFKLGEDDPDEPATDADEDA
jgi:sec-independent protein translocase protein TatC